MSASYPYKDEKPYPVFVYGTLRDKAFVERMLGHSIDTEEAELRDFVRLEPSFYMIFKHQGSKVNGLLIRDLTWADIAKFDRYEGHGYGFYERDSVWVMCDGKLIHAEAYVGGDHMKWFYQNWLENQA